MTRNENGMNADDLGDSQPGKPARKSRLVERAHAAREARARTQAQEAASPALEMDQAEKPIEANNQQSLAKSGGKSIAKSGKRNRQTPSRDEDITTRPMADDAAEELPAAGASDSPEASPASAAPATVASAKIDEEQERRVEQNATAQSSAREAGPARSPSPWGAPQSDEKPESSASWPIAPQGSTGQPAPSPANLTTVARGYLDHLRATGRSKATITSYEGDIEIAEQVFGLDQPMAAISPGDLVRFAASEPVRKTRTGRIKAKPTIDKTCRVIRQIFEWAIEEGILDSDPSRGLPLGRQPQDQE